VDDMTRRLVEQVEQLSEDRIERNARIRQLGDKVQAMQLTGDALATALAGFLGPNHQLIRMWDEAKRHGEVDVASREERQ
jgi:hypothetical protein